VIDVKSLHINFWQFQFLKIVTKFPPINNIIYWFFNVTLIMIRKQRHFCSIGFHGIIMLKNTFSQKHSATYICVTILVTTFWILTTFDINNIFDFTGDVLFCCDDFVLKFKVICHFNFATHQTIFTLTFFFLNTFLITIKKGTLT